MKKTAFLFITIWSIAAVAMAQIETPSDVRDRLGIYVWGKLAESADPLVAAIADPLVAAIEDVKSIGANKATRTSMGPYWDPRGANARESQFLPLYQKMHRADYWEFFNSFPVVMITAYDVASFSARYRLLERMSSTFLLQGKDRLEKHRISLQRIQVEPRVYRLLDLMTQNELASFLNDTTWEFRLFAYNLACEIPNGTFIISNWEAENDVFVASEDARNRYLEYIQARLDGVVAGMGDAESQGCSGKVYNAFEFVDIKALGGEWDQHTGKFSGITLAPKLRGLDFLSYSSWNSIGYMHPPHYIRASFTEAIRNIRSFARENGITGRLIICEFSVLWDIQPDGSRLKTIVDTALEEGVEYLLNWVAYDQPGNGVTVDGKWYDQSHFGKFFQNRELTPQGFSFRNILDGGMPMAR